MHEKNLFTSKPESQPTAPIPGEHGTLVPKRNYAPDATGPDHQSLLQKILFPSLFVFFVVAFATSIYLFGWSKPFSIFGVRPMEPYFADLRAIAGAMDAQDQGLKPWLQNPGDPWGRVLPYPVIWVTLFRLIGRLGDPVLIFGSTQLLVLIGLGLWLSRRREGYLAVLLALSPPMMLAIERGSNNICILLLMIAGVWRSGMLGGLILGLATALKFFPAVSIVYMAALRTNYRFLVGAALTLPFIVWSFLQLPRVYHLFPSITYYSFGIKSFRNLLNIFEAALVGPESIPIGAASIYTVYAGFLIMTYFLWYYLRATYCRLFNTIRSLGETPTRFAIVFIATFVAIFLTGSNASYFLLYLIPVLVVFSMAFNKESSIIALTLLIFGLIIFFVPLLPYWGMLIAPAVLFYTILMAPLLIEATLEIVSRHWPVRRAGNS